MMLFFGFLVVVVFIWMAKSGQFDDLDGAANSIFMDDEYEDNEELVESAKKESLEEKEKVKNHQGGGIKNEK